MSLWDVVGSLAGSFAEGYSQSAAAPAGYQPQGQIRRFLAQLNWSVDEQRGETLYLHFSNKNRLRKVMIHGADDAVVRFTTSSAFSAPAAKVPRELTAYLLNRNLSSPFWGWVATDGDDGDLEFGVTYMALAAGLNAQVLKVICETIIEEVGAFDGKLEAAGYL